MPASRKQNVSDAVRGIIERLFLKTLREAASAGRGAASQSINATLVSGAMAARVASGILAGIADSLSHKSPRRPD